MGAVAVSAWKSLVSGNAIVAELWRQLR